MPKCPESARVSGARVARRKLRSHTCYSNRGRINECKVVQSTKACCLCAMSPTDREKGSSVVRGRHLLASFRRSGGG